VGWQRAALARDAQPLSEQGFTPDALESDDYKAPHRIGQRVDGVDAHPALQDRAPLVAALEATIIAAAVFIALRTIF